MQLALNLNPGRMRFCVLGSGSGGNAVVIESEGESILVDCGFSGREIVRRMRSVGVGPESLSAILVSHEHSDHCRGLAQMRKRFGTDLFATRGTLEALRATGWGQPLTAEHPQPLGGLQVTPIGLPHDAREPVGFLIEGIDGERMAIIADLGHAQPGLWQRLGDLDALVIESNHDEEMLTTGPYPWSLKRRILGERGHLSNSAAAAGLRDVASDRLQVVVLYHLSRTNNRPDIARATAGDTLRRLGAKAEVVVSGQFEPTEWVTVG